MDKVVIDGGNLTLEMVKAVSLGSMEISLSSDSRERMQASRKAVEDILDSGEVVYGINTGFGALSSVRIEDSQLEELQSNLVRSHACGIGETMDPDIVLMMMTIRANSLAKGVSGIRPSVVDTLLGMVNSRIAPSIPRIGSLGASGDLAPLSHMTMGMMGEGQCLVQVADKWVSKDSRTALEEAGLEPVKLQAKEGLSWINGTSQMWAHTNCTKHGDLVSHSRRLRRMFSGGN